MAASSHEIINEARRGLRVKDNVPVRWSIKDGYDSGEGKVINISTSGLLLLTKKDFSPMENSVVALESFGESNGHFLPREGRLVWSKSRGPRNNRICGIEFIQPEEKVISNLRERVQKGITQVANARRTRSIIGSILLWGMAVLSAFVVKQYVENYQTMVSSHQLMTEAFDQQAALSQFYAKELTSTKAILAETQALLAKSQADNANLQALVQELNQKTEQFQVKMAELEQKNTELNGQLNVIQERLRLLEGDVRNMDEGRSVIKMYKQNLRKVKLKIVEFKREASYAKIAAQKEKDRIESLIGNNGFLVKNGKAYQRPDSSAVIKGTNDNRVDVDVKFMK